MTDETTNPETGVVTAPEEQDFSDFEKSIQQPTEAKPDVLPAEDDEPTDFAEGDTPEGEAPEEAPAEDDEFEWIEHKGEKYKVPKDSVLMHADYTRKTQEVAELRRRLEPLVQHAEGLSQVEREAQAEFINVSNQIARYEGVDWAAWREADPTAALQAQVDLQALHTRQGQIGQAYQQAQAQRLSIANYERTTRIEEGSKVLAERIPNWGETKQRELSQHAIDSYGFDPTELAGIDDPRLILVLNDAAQFRALQKKQQQAAKAVKAQEVKPVPTLKGNQGRQSVHADTNDFRAFEKLADAKIRSRR